MISATSIFVSSPSQISAGSIGTTQLADSAVTSAKIAADTIVAADIAAGAVDSAEIANGAVDAAHCNNTEVALLATAQTYTTSRTITKTGSDFLLTATQTGNGHGGGAIKGVANYEAGYTQYALNGHITGLSDGNTHNLALTCAVTAGQTVATRNGILFSNNASGTVTNTYAAYVESDFLAGGAIGTYADRIRINTAAGVRYVPIYS